LSSCLRQAGHDVQCAFLPPKRDEKSRKHKFQATYSVELLDELAELCADSQLVGLSLMTNQFLAAVAVTAHLRKRLSSIPIVWGGVQPTVEPEECLEYADIVCLGEGEGALVDLANRMAQGGHYLDIDNMWFKTEDGIVRNSMRPLEQYLDTIPLPDYSCDNHFAAIQNHIEPLTRNRLAAFVGERFKPEEGSIRYPIMSSRGCTFACTYCCNSVYGGLYSQQKWLRWRSPENAISELKMLQKEIGPLDFVYIVDDNFAAQPLRRLKAFCEQYQREIGSPFSCQVSPLTVSEEKLEVLLGAGCAKVTMGVETASERVAALYGRQKFHKVLPAAIALLEKYRPRMSQSPTYQFIIDNPYETLDETVETLRLATSVSRPWHNPIYSLMFFPGTPLYERALQDGVITDKHAQIYSRNWLAQSQPFFQFWIRLYKANITPLLLRALLARGSVRLLTGELANKVWRSWLFRWLWDAI
jgi:anaerobic magnesium-protoporphyrin IX monomethyl ester cyclase